MDILALLIAIVGLVLAAVAYWRSGGHRDVALLRQEFEREIEALRAKQKELTDSVAHAATDAYEASRVRLGHVGQRLDHLKDEAIEGLEAQIEVAGKQLQTLRHRLTEGLTSARDSTRSAAHRAEQGLMRRVHRLEARTTLLYAKSKVQRAVGRANREEFALAERRLEEAAELLRAARETLGDDRAYDDSLDDVKHALQEATAAVRSKAADARQRIEHVLSEADSLVTNLETDERKDEREEGEKQAQ